MEFKDKFSFLVLLFSLISCVPSTVTNTSKNPPTETSNGTHEDPLASYAWHLNNTAQSTFSSSTGTSGQDMSISAVHDLEIKGRGIKIAVSDTGVEVNHLDLIVNQLTSLHRDYSASDSSLWSGGNPYPIEHEAHGTAVTGLLAAEGWNGVGSRGVAPSAQYGAFLFIGGFHLSDVSYEAKLLDQMTGSFDIFNYSYGYLGCDFYPASISVLESYKDGVTTLRDGKGALYVKAAGNDFIGNNSDCDSSLTDSYLGNTNTDEEQNTPYVILTAAVNAKGKISSYSTPGSGLWVSSLGGEFGTDSPAMLSTDMTSCALGMSTSTSSVAGFNKGSSALNSFCNYTSIMNGTSSATPVLSGVIALILEANPNLSWRDVKHILAMTADKINYSLLPMPHPGGSGWGLSGHAYDYVYVKNHADIYFSNTYGFGRANALRAVQMARGYVSELGAYLETLDIPSASLNLEIPDQSSIGVTDQIHVIQDYAIESIQIKISTDHPHVGDLGVELTSPSGTTSKLLLINSNIQHAGLSDYTLLTNAFYKEHSAGNWTIKVIDGAASDIGHLTSWKIKVNGH